MSGITNSAETPKEEASTKEQLTDPNTDSAPLDLLFESPYCTGDIVGFSFCNPICDYLFKRIDYDEIGSIMLELDRGLEEP